MQIIKLNKSIKMSSLQIAELCNKKHTRVLRDICKMFKLLDNPFLDDTEVVRFIDNKGCTKEYLLNEEYILTLVSGYNIKSRNAVIKQCQVMREALATCLMLK